MYKRSFLPSSINTWNTLNESVRHMESTNRFKKLYNINKSNISELFKNYGIRKCQIIHCRLRLECSDLNGHRRKRFIHPTSVCECGHQNEDNIHYLCQCPLYTHLRDQSYFYVNSFDTK